jgi:hypothetical protein
LSKVARAVIGVAILIALVVLVNNYYGQYKRATGSRAATTTSEPSSSANATEVIAVSGGGRVLVLANGVILRATPATTGATVRALKKGETLILVGTAGSWLQLRDAGNGKLGFVANDSKAVRLQK